MNIYTYLNYREFLQEALKDKKARNPNFSFRYIAQRLNLKSPTFFNWVLQGKKRLSENLAHRVADLFDLNAQEKHFFIFLVQYGNAKTQAEKTFYFDQIIALRIKKSGTINSHQYAYYNAWYHSVIREVLETIEFAGNFKELASMLRPKISEKKARASVELLIKLKLVEKTSKGVYKNINNNILTTGDRWESKIIDNFQVELIELAKNAFSDFDKTERDVSNVFAGLSSENFAHVKEKIKEFRKYILTLSQEDQKIEKVFLCNIQLFPITQSLENLK